MNAPARAIPFDVLNQDERAALEQALWDRLDHDDPMANTSEETYELLVKLASAKSKLKQLERDFKEALRQKGNEKAARVIKFQEYVDEYERREGIEARNRGLSEPENGPQPARASSLDAMLSSPSTFLRAQGLLDLHMKDRIWFDDFYQRPMSNWDGVSDEVSDIFIDDAWRLRVHTWLHLQDNALAKTDLGNTNKAIDAIADRVHKNSAADFLKALPWDETPRLKEWLHKVYNVPNDYYHERVGTNFFVGAAARLMEPGCKLDTMMVLLGGEGIGKTTSLQVIGQQWYGSVSTSLAKKPEDFKTSLHGKSIIEIPEMQAFTKAESAALKDLLSTPVDLYRPVWGRMGEFKRTCVMVSTTNEFDWHNDAAGFRRFFPVDCVGWPQPEGRNKIDLPWLKENFLHLWAEARVLYEGGASWHGDELQEEQAKRVADHTADEPWQDLIADWLETSEPNLYTGPGCGIEPMIGDVVHQAVETFAYWGTLLTTPRIATSVIKIPADRQSRKDAIRIARAMKRLGWDLKNVRPKNGEQRKCWVRADIEPKKPTSEASQG